MLVVGVFLGSLDTASNSLVVYMLGPALAPPLTQSLHAMVALGFVLGSLLIRPFLPDTGHTGDTGEVCRPQRQLRYIEWKGVKIYDFQKVTFSNLFKLHIAGLGVLIPKRYHMLG